MHPLLDYWPIALVAGAGLIGWGELHTKVARMREELDDKASREAVDSIEARLVRIEDKLDRLVERL